MYFKHITLENVGPIEKLDFEFPINEDGTPKPVFFVGENGSGKSIVLSHLVNFLVSAKQLAFDNAETDSGKVYKIRSPRYITIGKDYSYSKVITNSDEYQIEWSLNRIASEYTSPPNNPDWHLIPHNESNLFKSSVETKDKSLNLFSKSVVLYLPPNRFEEPAWLNIHNLNAKANYTDLRNITGYSDRKMIDYSPLKENQNWLLDLLFDRHVFDMKILNIPLNPTESSEETTPEISFFGGFSGASASLFEEILKGINIILQKNRSLRFGVGTRHDRVISIMDKETNEQVVPNLFQLSTGETLLLNLYLSILRDFDLANGSFSRLEDVSGVVIIDEIDMHLHTTFQRTILPKLIKLFPKIQFIATTHSPLLLLGLEKELGADKITIINLPEGKEISVSSFSEFGAAYDAFKETQAFTKDLEKAISESTKPLLYVEGDYDTKYLKKAATLFNKTDLLNKFDIRDGDGYQNLSKIWDAFHKTNFSQTIQSLIVLLYDCDTNVQNMNKLNKYKRCMPVQSDTPVKKGVENLFSLKTIEKARAYKREMISITTEEDRDEIITTYKVHKDEKRNLCDWLCDNGEQEDFERFTVIFDMLDEIISENDTNNIST